MNHDLTQKKQCRIWFWTPNKVWSIYNTILILSFRRLSSSETKMVHMTGHTTRTWPPTGPKCQDPQKQKSSKTNTNRKRSRHNTKTWSETRKFNKILENKQKLKQNFRTTQLQVLRTTQLEMERITWNRWPKNPYS